MIFKLTSPLKGKKVLITGGCGFLGSHLAKRLLSMGSKVFIMKREESNPWRLKEYINSINFYTADVSNPPQVDKCLKTIEPEYIFHLASYGVDSSQKDYLKAANINILGIVNVFNSLKYVDCRKVINIGSSAEYGNVNEKITETFCPKPASIYGSTKACATLLCHQLAMENDISAVTLRPFGIFGEGEEPHKLFSYIILSILKGEAVHLTSCGQYRDYCYIENIIDAMILCAEDKDVNNQIFNVGTGTSKPLSHYVDLIFNLMGTSMIPNYGSIAYRKNEMWDPCPDISKIKNVTGWTPKINLEEGLKKTIAWYKENLNYFPI
ncbi:NAD-dependent epimerase/dehydratase family protein [Clostridium polynesiense]|uniref:NAD-dependent epimerase/dehydratase family protein n=1 Tax=Clostridium polynesiense TaxID=1325933 RepID=UPI00058FD158|nr:SDR family NAD(P)-dependent oxidoreductase [Clostridium polynesiense]